MIKAVVFDLDDTLISEKEYIKSGYKSVAKFIEKKYKLDQGKVYNQLMELFRKSPKNVFNRFFEKNNIQYGKIEIDKLIENYRKHKPEIYFFDDVKPTIMKLKKIGIKTGIITDGYKETQRNKLEVLKAKELFDQIIITDELGREYWKPNPMAFELMKQALKVEYNEMIYVGDNPEKDFYIGSVYPITCVRIRRDENIYNDKEYRNGITEKIRINKLNELEKMI